MSVYIEETAIAHGQVPLDFLNEEWSNHFLAAITAGWARQCEQKILRTGTTAEPAHADVVGRKKPPIRKKLAEQAEWVVAPTNLEEPLAEDGGDP